MINGWMVKDADAVAVPLFFIWGSRGVVLGWLAAAAAAHGLMRAAARRRTTRVCVEQ
jgi:hypothetical protein